MRVSQKATCQREGRTNWRRGLAGCGNTVLRRGVMHQVDTCAGSGTKYNKYIAHGPLSKTDAVWPGGLVGLIAGPSWHAWQLRLEEDSVRKLGSALFLGVPSRPHGKNRSFFPISRCIWFLNNDSNGSLSHGMAGQQENRGYRSHNARDRPSLLLPPTIPQILGSCSVEHELLQG